MPSQWEAWATQLVSSHCLPQLEKSLVSNEDGVAKIKKKKKCHELKMCMSLIPVWGTKILRLHSTAKTRGGGVLQIIKFCKYVTGRDD